MALFVLNSLVTIQSSVSGFGDLQFSGVHEVHIKKTMHSIAETATISLPSIGKYLPADGSAPVIMATGQMFNDRDPITISLGYNGQMNIEFEGFVKHRNLDMPLVVECEGYVQQLKLDVNISANFIKTSTSAKALLELACKGTDITVQCPVDLPLSGIKLINWDGVRICDYIRQASGHTLTLFFIQPSVLWCGLTYTAYSRSAVPEGSGSAANGTVFELPTVNYRIGYNTPKNNGLKQKDDSEPVQVIMNGKTAGAVQLLMQSGNNSAVRKVKSTMNNVPDNATLAKFAQEKAYQMNYTGFEGKVNGFLQPFALPGYNAYITDAQHPRLTGTYLIESTEVKFGVSGAKRICEIGPAVGFS